MGPADADYGSGIVACDNQLVCLRKSGAAIEVEANRCIAEEKFD
jgi:hypothetical protein